MNAVYLAAAGLALAVLLLAPTALWWVDHGPLPRVPADVQARIDQALPREHAHERWVANRDEMRQ